MAGSGLCKSSAVFASHSLLTPTPCDTAPILIEWITDFFTTQAVHERKDKKE